MTPRGLIALAVVAGLGAAGAGWVVWYNAGVYAAPTVEKRPFFPELAAAPAGVDAIDVDAPEYKLQVAKTEAGWVARSDADYPVREEVAARLIADLAAMRPLEAKTSNPDWYKWIGVEDRDAANSPSSLVRMGHGGAELANVLVGKVSASLGADPVGGTFVRVPGDTQAWLVSGMTRIPPTKRAWFDDIVNIAGPDLTRVAVAEGGQVRFDARRANGNAEYSLTTPATDGSAFNGSLLRRMAGAVVSMSFDTVRAIGADAPAAQRVVTFETSDGLVLEAKLVTIEEKPWVMFEARGAGAEVEKLAAEIFTRTTGRAFRLPDATMLALMTKVEDLLTPEAEPERPNAPGQIITDPAQLGLPG